ncbi:hypothetical protein Gpo141_00012867, partial [Globisporangium polare]
AEHTILGATTHSDLHTVVRGLGTDVHDEDELMSFLVSMKAGSVDSGKTEASRGAECVDARFEAPRVSKEKPQRTVSSRSLLPSRLLQQLFQSQDEKLSDKCEPGSFTTKFTMRDIEQKRAEVRREIETRASSSSSVPH